MIHMDMQSWYRALNKPSWAPPEQRFGHVWSVLYPIIFAVNAYVLYLVMAQKIPVKAGVPFWINLALNFLYTPVQFGLKNQALSSVVIVGVLFTTGWAIVGIWPYSKAAALAFVPYLSWVAIATVLQLSLWWLNRG